MLDLEDLRPRSPVRAHASANPQYLFEVEVLSKNSIIDICYANCNTRVLPGQVESDVGQEV